MTQAKKIGCILLLPLRRYWHVLISEIRCVGLFHPCWLINARISLSEREVVLVGGLARSLLDYLDLTFLVLALHAERNEVVCGLELCG